MEKMRTGNALRQAAGDIRLMPGGMKPPAPHRLPAARVYFGI
jgi:hypothetical protein